MNSVRCVTFLKHTTLLCAALALSLGSASAQISTVPNSSSSTGVSSSESSSNALQLADDGGAPVSGMSGSDALPAAPSPHGSGGGQYDNKGVRGGGASGIRSHLTYEVGGGLNAPTSDSSPYITWGGNVTAGGGYRFNRNLSLMMEYQFIDSKLPGQIIAEAGATGGNDHIWSLTLDPVVEFNPKSSIGFYATGGYGFYRKVTSFTDPQQSVYCDYFYGCGTITQNVVVGHFSSNQGGWSIGGGLEHRFAGWNGDGKMKIFAEARYLDVLSPAVTTEPNGLGATTVGKDTKIIPVTVGLRF